jgi:hypothetical protein
MAPARSDAFFEQFCLGRLVLKWAAMSTGFGNQIDELSIPAMA